MPETYTAPSATQQRVDEMLKPYGGYEANMTPTEFQQKVVGQMIEQDKPLQEALQTQQQQVSELDLQKLRQADQAMSQEYSQANRDLMMKTAQAQGELRQGAQTWGSDPQRTIASGPLNLDLAAFTQAYQPASNSILSPFVGEGIRTGEVARSTDIYSLADLQRAARERIIGTEAQALAKIYEEQLGMRKYEAELKAKQDRLKYEDERNYAMLMGGTVTNPLTGAVENYPSPEEKARRDKQIVDQTDGDDKTVATWESILQNAKTEFDIWKQIDINQDALRQAGVDVDKLWAWHKNLADRVGTGGSVAGVRITSPETKTMTPQQLSDLRLELISDISEFKNQFDSKQDGAFDRNQVLERIRVAYPELGEEEINKILNVYWPASQPTQPVDEGKYRPLNRPLSKEEKELINTLYGPKWPVLFGIDKGK